MPKSGSVAVVPLKKEKDCKGVVRYKTDDVEAALSNAYVSRGFSKPMPEEIVLVAVAVPPGADAKRLASEVENLLMPLVA